MVHAVLRKGDLEARVQLVTAVVVRQSLAQPRPDHAQVAVEVFGYKVDRKRVARLPFQGLHKDGPPAAPPNTFFGEARSRRPIRA